eukprot:1033857-Alexandrium_andersonii.AAC.1
MSLTRRRGGSRARSLPEKTSTLRGQHPPRCAAPGAGVREEGGAQDAAVGRRGGGARGAAGGAP